MTKIHTIDGVQYREAARKVRLSDRYIVSLVDYNDITAGKAYEVTHVDSYGDPEFVDDAGDYNGLSEGEYVVLEPVFSALESELAAMKAKVAEMERQLAEAKVADRLKVGDYAKIAEGIDDGYAKSGDIVEIIDTGRRFDFKVRKIGDTNGCTYFDAAALVRATDEEVAEAKRKAVRPKIGEYVRVTQNRGGHFAKAGDILRVWDIVDYGGNQIRCEKLDGSRRGNDYFYDDELEALTEEEAKWAAIGRKPGEFKTGDVVRLLDSRALGFTARSVIKDGDIGILGEEDTDGTFRFMCKGIDRGNWVLPKRIELVAPVESVVNLRGGDVA